MEITSYLLGKKSAGGGGSSSGLDWKTLGYDPAPLPVVDDYNYSKTIQENWDASQTNLSNKFSGNTELKYMPLVDTKNATTMYRMFYGCISLLGFPALETTNKLTDISEMFRNCQELVQVDMSHFDTTNITSISQLFRGCGKLQKIDMRNLDFTQLTSYNYAFGSVPANCLIIVKDTTQKEWLATNFSTLTNVKTVSEL